MKGSKINHEIFMKPKIPKVINSTLLLLSLSQTKLRSAMIHYQKRERALEPLMVIIKKYKIGNTELEVNIKACITWIRINK